MFLSTNPYSADHHWLLPHSVITYLFVSALCSCIFLVATKFWKLNDATFFHQQPSFKYKHISNELSTSYKVWICLALHSISTTYCIIEIMITEWLFRWFKRSNFPFSSSLNFWTKATFFSLHLPFIRLLTPQLLATFFPTHHVFQQWFLKP